MGVGEALYEACVIIYGLLYACLLEHCFGHEDEVGVVCVAPGQIAFVGLIPDEELACECFGVHIIVRGEEVQK